MKHKQITLIFALALIPIMYGCSSVGSTGGMVQAKHNGKFYWFPPDCPQYRYSNDNPDRLYCILNGEPTGRVLDPADQQQMQYHYQEEERRAQQWRELGESARNLGRNAYGNSGSTINCHQFGDFSFNKEIKTFKGSTCPLGWTPAY